MARVLIVEDESDLRMLYQLALRTSGHEIIEADSGARAMEVLSQVAIDAVVLDLGLPDIGGLQLMNEVLSRQPELPIIINSGCDQFRAKCLSSGAAAFVVKASGHEELKRALARVIPPQQRDTVVKDAASFGA